MRQRTHVAAMLVALLSALICVDPAGAIDITFTEPADDAADATVDVSVVGLLSPSITATTSSTAETGRAEIVFTLGPDTIVTNRPPRAVAALLEPGSTPQAPVVSDLLFISEEPASIPGGPLRARLSFEFDSSSNVEGQPLPAGIPAANVFVENGQPQIIFTTTLITSIGELPLTIIAQSDAVEVMVPEPSTLLLVGARLLRIGVAARRRSHRS